MDADTGAERGGVIVSAFLSGTFVSAIAVQTFFKVIYLEV